MALENCPRCKGTSWIFTEIDGIEAVTRCPCEEETRPERYAAKSGIPLLYKNASTENFILPKDRSPGFGSIHSDSIAQLGLGFPTPPLLG